MSMPTTAERRIDRLPELVATLPGEEANLFHRIYDLRRERGLVDRGSLEVQISDIAAMELYAQSVVSADPFAVATVLGKML